jgi:RES domain-containing protein
LIRVWRICVRSYLRTPFAGEGARLNGGRWNPPGVSMVYTAAALSLAALELFVNLDPEELPSNLISIHALIPATVRINSVDPENLPRNWRAFPAPDVLRKLGADWITGGRTAVLSVPSAILPKERNYLLNPAHPDFKRIKIGTSARFSFDPRMWQ